MCDVKSAARSEDVKGMSNMKESRKRFLVGSSSPPDRGSGISSYAKEIAVELGARGYGVWFAAPPPENTSWLDEHKIVLVPTPYDENPTDSTEYLIETVRDNDIEGIINNDNAMVQNIAPAVSCAFVAVGHLDYTTISAMMKHNVDWVDYAVAISSDMQLRLLNRLNVDPTRVPLVHNGIRDFGYVADRRKHAKQKLRVISGGGLNRRKGAEKIVGLLRKCIGANNLRFDVFGVTPRGVPEDLARADNIHFHGQVDRSVFLDALATSDVFLMPSRAEGCPMALLEAISCGVIPLVSDGVGAMRWIITNGEEGFVCRYVKWVEEAFECLRFLSTTPTEVGRMALVARKTFENHYRVEYTVDKLCALLLKPRVGRGSIPATISLIKWHRQAYGQANLMDRVRFHLGVLVHHATIATS